MYAYWTLCINERESSRYLKFKEFQRDNVFSFGVRGLCIRILRDSEGSIFKIKMVNGRRFGHGCQNPRLWDQSPVVVFIHFSNFNAICLLFSPIQVHIYTLLTNTEYYCFFKEDCCLRNPFLFYITRGVFYQISIEMEITDMLGNSSSCLFDQKIQVKLWPYTIIDAWLHLSNSDGSIVGQIHFVLCLLCPEIKNLSLILRNGQIKLYVHHYEKEISSSSSTTLQSVYQETKKVTAACWACSAGTKVVVGYSNGDIIVWNVPCPSDSKTDLCQITTILKLNLGYKADKIPIAKLKWVDADGKSSRLYVLGCSDHHSVDLVQVVLLNEHTESRTIKLGLYPPESLVDMEITTNSIEQNRHRRDSLLLLGRSNHVYAYDDSSIERYLAQSQTKSSPSLPKEITIKLPYGDSRITVTKFVTCLPCMPCSTDEDFNLIAKNSLPLFPFETSLKEGSNSNSATFSPFSKARNLYITGHSSGAINFWDASCPLLLPIASITQQSDNDFSISGVPLTALCFIYHSHILMSGDQSGTVRIYTLKSESFAPQSTFLSSQGSSKKGSNHIIRRIKVVKVNGAVLSITPTENIKQLAVGSDQGYVSLIDPEGPTVLYQIHIASEFSTGIISTHFETCSFHGFEKNVLIVATKDSSLFTLERDTGNTLSSGIVRPSKPSKALFIRVLAFLIDEHGTSGRGSSVPDGVDINSDNSAPKQSLLLLCSEKAVYAYSLLHLVQGIKKVVYKKKFNSSCYWASTFGSPDAGLILLFASGKIEIRTRREIRIIIAIGKRVLQLGLTSSKPSEIIVSSSHDGELIIVNGDQELLFVSTLPHKEAYRLLDYVSQVFNKDVINAQGLISSPSVKEKKKGLFGSVIKDNKGCIKSKNGVVVETEDCRQSIEELSMIFSTVNLPTDTETEAKIVMNEEDVDLDIDDIEIEDPKGKPRGYPVIAGLNRQNITNTFQAFKGKLKHAKVKNDKVAVKEEAEEEKSGAVDQIKKKYGFSSSRESSVANTARTKLSENLKKLQGISLKTSEMQDTARSFSSMAKEVLRFTENDKKGPSPS
ncbi:hypothetical protein BUALT_Bualt04G0042900 [Buddleja alternifolia]|uniref:Lethal giant larvae (Lgl)-like C-terminal domain-containing protein n=1 Tax=Buddleja alternifolia TaxID=168488 RepID=A0AAV6XUC7_9LAMI|nr:hypothetical protein BUALT_Bualt04G0042900 [Buddleja alternifolia]